MSVEPMPVKPPPVGNHLREWRQRRRMSQLDLACEAEISTRHLSFMETGRSTPSREMILHLSEQLEIPMRERNVLLLAAGYAPIFPERPLDDPQLKHARAAMEIVMNGHKPYPAFALDRHWQMIASNGALPQLYEGVRPDLLQAPINVLRLSLHPHGLAPRIINLGEWAMHLRTRLTQQISLTADPVLIELKKELDDYSKSLRCPPDVVRRLTAGEVVIPFRLRVGEAVLSFFSTTMVFGTPVDITLSELALESFFPADTATATMVRDLA
jgi:transcriptional regulator with XRE-family HTH domain